jgi:hypothetical protein
MLTRSARIGDSTPVVTAGTPAPPGSGTGRPRGADARPQIWRFAIRQIRTLAAPDGQHGVLQHATFTIPNYRHGYCTDDNQDDFWASGEGIKLPCADDSNKSQDRTVGPEDSFYRSRWIRIDGWFILDKHSMECEQA